jgi:hypothetical protein
MDSGRATNGSYRFLYVEICLLYECFLVFSASLSHFHTVTVEVSNKVHQRMVQSPEFESTLVTLALPCNNFLQCTFNLQLDWIILCFCDYKCFFEDE